ncbi:MAG TPA: T9SS type A sorting domain-containing protein [Williamwhitmania sp.]|nr:T9SS type A sorting domain-containing protein [Williamwhitmania sp.]
MKKALLILSITALSTSLSWAQDVVAGWSFATNSVLADQGTTANVGVATLGTESGRTISWKNGFTDNAAQTVGWDNGADTKYWYVQFSTQGYGSLKISSKQQSGGTNPGPQDFKLQYKVGDGDFTDVPNTAITVKNDWTTGVLASVDIPSEASNTSDMVTLRWIMTSNTNSAGGTVDAAGISKIDDIVVTGVAIPTYTLNLSHSGNGTIDPADGDHTYYEGDEVILTATPDQGWVFEKWVVDGDDITTATTQVTVGASISAMAYFTATTGIEEISNAVSVYPNPSKGTFYLKNMSGVKSVEIYSIIGKMVASKQITSVNDFISTSLPKGCYMMKIDRDNGKSEVRKVIIN